MNYIQGKARNEFQLVSLDEAIESDSQVRVIDAIVDTLNPTELGYKIKESKNKSGRPGFDVFTMTKLFILGYRLGIRSGRKLETACKYDTRFKWLLEERTPDANVINDFRKDNLTYLKNMFYELNRMYIKLDILKIKNTSQDGFKIKASNSKDKNYTLNKLVDRIKREKKKINLTEKEITKLEEQNKLTREYLEILEKNEILEDIETKIESKKRELEEVQAKLIKHEDLVDKMKKDKVTQISLTDEESKLMKNNGTFEVCYNNQTTVDMDTHITVAIETDNNPADIGSMRTMADIMKKEYGDEGVITDTTDKGYISTTDMVECLEKGVIPQVTPLDKNTTEVELETIYEENEITEEERTSTKSEDIKKCLRSGVIPECYEEYVDKLEVEEKEIKIEEESESVEERRSSEEIRETAIENQTFERDIKLNAVFCPAGELLAQKSKRNDGKIRYANKLACKNCKNPCTFAKFKEVDFKEGQKTLIPKCNQSSAPRKKAAKRKEKQKVVKITLKLNEELLKKRMQTSEHSQGTMKTVDNHRSFNMRGLKKVSAEMAIYFTASNIRRVCNIVGVTEMLNKIKNTFQTNQKYVILGV